MARDGVRRTVVVVLRGVDLCVVIGNARFGYHEIVLLVVGRVRAENELLDGEVAGGSFPLDLRQITRGVRRKRVNISSNPRPSELPRGRDG